MVDGFADEAYDSRPEGGTAIGGAGAPSPGPDLPSIQSVVEPILDLKIVEELLVELWKIPRWALSLFLGRIDIDRAGFRGDLPPQVRVQIDSAQPDARPVPDSPLCRERIA
jgi:hypothetical protein